MINRLYLACINGDIGAINGNIQRSDDIDYALQLAAMNGHHEIVKLLLLSGARANAYNSDALIWASNNGHLEIVLTLLAHGAHISTNSNAALRYAAENGHHNVVLRLVERGANIHDVQEYALRWSLINNHENIAKHLISLNADITTHANCALRIVCRNGHINIIKLLTKYVTDAHAIEQAVQMAVENNQLESLKILLDEYKSIRIDKNLIDEAKNYGNLEMMRYLIMLVR